MEYQIRKITRWSTNTVNEGDVMLSNCDRLHCCPRPPKGTVQRLLRLTPDCLTDGFRRALSDAVRIEHGHLE